ncbi:DUF3566 domain-containing protein [Cellulomonas sp. DKR-3]|uniref:DUF3566 domain-containing protein n=1 Tax=Cellulomonas fulva TaxID=2835530 RepID=A0ABS5TWF3_9CELL|nr:DUF3566 domain-containing protein [Cellulomonas fulva]MBT0993482.1 DUF3566 domain-containing protein [Cellulomonas fulva]
MTDPAPPSIPPRQKPTPAPTSSARTVGSSGGKGGTTPRAASAAPAPARPTTGSSAEAQREKDTVPPPPAPPAGGGAAEQDPPTPLATAVDKTTSWFKKAAGATTAAISTATTRPQSEDDSMTTTSTRPATATSPAAAPQVPPRTETGAGSSARPATGRIATVAAGGGPRRVRLAISRIDPWSVMKLSFLMSVAFGILIVVAVGVVWYTLNGMHVFTNIDDLVRQVTGDESQIDILQYVQFNRVISGATLIAVVDVFLLTALATIGAFLYNIVAALVGGLHVTMTDE